MAYFVTGATGFIGRFLVTNLLKRGAPVYVLVRKGSAKKLDAMRAKWGVTGKQVIPVTGDLGKKGLGVSAADTKKLKGKVQHFFHLAAIYDLAASAEDQELANVEGTRHAVQFAHAIGAGCFHHVSSIAAAGVYKGTFREDMFDEATGLDNPYFKTKHDAEAIVRTECKRPFRIYRPGIVVGDTKTGFIDKIDGPYYFFTLLQKMGRILPKWLPMVGVEGGRMNIVPVDFVAAAMDHIAHKKGLDGKCFHLTDPKPHRVGEVLNIFAKAGKATQMKMRVNAKVLDLVPESLLQGLTSLAPVQKLSRSMMSDLEIPPDVFRFVSWPTRYDNRETTKALRGSGIEVPPLESYAQTLWDFWDRRLNPDAKVNRKLTNQVRNRVVVVTGASSGIGKAAALKLAAGGAVVILVARGEEALLATKHEIDAMGGQAFICTCDVSDLASCDALVARVLEEHGGCDVLINNAGRSIRRGVTNSFDRFHDFERTMQLNYFGALRLIMGFLPRMIEQRRGHVINISSIGVLTNAPRFSAYVASKAALDAFTRCAASEYADMGIAFTTINMPLVRTPMIAPTRIYQNVPTLSPEDAAELVVEAIVYRPVRIATRLGIFGEVLHALLPRVAQIVMNTTFRMFPDSSASQGRKTEGEAPRPSADQIAFASLMRGIHF